MMDSGIPVRLSIAVLLVPVLLLPEHSFATPTLARQQQIIELLRQDCGACHGMTLKGGLGPALTAEALAGKHPTLLRETISKGRPGTPMPPWSEFLDAEEIAWLVNKMRTGLDHEP